MCNISGNLLLSESEGEEFTQHIVGTRLEDLTQIYNGRIVIKGSLSLNHVQVSANGDNFFTDPIHENPQEQNAVQLPNIVVNNVTFDMANVIQSFWMKSFDQVSWL